MKNQKRKLTLALLLLPLALLAGEPAKFVLVKETSEVVTNVVETSNASGCRTYDQLHPQGNGIFAIPAIHHPWHEGCRSYTPATERTITTTVVRREKLVFDWNGPREIVRETELSRSVEVLKLKSEWERVSLQTNVPPPVSSMSVTNYSVFGQALVATNIYFYENKTQ